MQWKRAAELAGLQLLDPVPLAVYERELLLYCCEGPERLLALIMEPGWGKEAGSETLLILLLGVEARYATAAARSLSFLYALFEGLGCSPRRPKLVVLNAQPPADCARLVVEELGLSGEWLGVYPLWSLGYALGRRRELGAGIELRLACGKCPSNACRVLASILHAAGVLIELEEDGVCLEARQYVESGVRSQRECRSGATRVDCKLEEGYLRFEPCRVMLELAALILGADRDCISDVEKFSAKTRLGLCEAAGILAFKRLYDILIYRRSL